VEQIPKNLQAFGDDLMRSAALDVDDKTDAARVVLVTRIIKAGGGRR
jgi:hypothetical protein